MNFQEHTEFVEDALRVADAIKAITVIQESDCIKWGDIELLGEKKKAIADLFLRKHFGLTQDSNGASPAEQLSVVRCEQP